VDAIGADSQIATRRAPIGEADRDCPGVLLDRNAAGTEGEVSVADCSAERIVQIRPVEVVEECPPVRRGYFGKWHACQEGAAVAVAGVIREGNDSDDAQHVGEPQPVQDRDGE
jgi:hypothetical protein